MTGHVKTYRFTVQGHVQGVGFRWYAREKALMCRLTGYARNDSRGQVVIVARGDGVSLETYRDYLRAGPQRSRVSRIICEEEADQAEFAGFEIRR